MTKKNKQEKMIMLGLLVFFILLVMNRVGENRKRKAAAATSILAYEAQMASGTSGVASLQQFAKPAGKRTVRIRQRRPAKGGKTPVGAQEKLFDRDVLRIPAVLIPEPGAVEVVEVAEEMPVILPEFVLEGVTWGGAEPMAIVEGKVMREGDMIEGAKVTQITSEGVTFEYLKKAFTLTLKESLGE